MTKRSAVHSTFVIERKIAATPERVFKAFSDPKAKARWFGGPAEWTRGEQKMDFRVGGRESSSGGPKGGFVSRYEAYYYDIVPNERIVFTYEMHLDDTKISVSLTTVEFERAGDGTLMTFTEQDVFLDGFDDAGGREHGTKELINQLEASLRADV